MRGEVGSRPSNTQSDSPQGNVPSSGGNNKKTKSNYIYYTSIDGNAYEQIHQQNGSIIDYNNNPGVQYVKVIAKGDNGKEYIKYTDQNGYYSFNNLKPGKYTLSFEYGKEDDFTKEESIRTNLKYNGLDYTANAAGTIKNPKSIIDRTIDNSGTGATEVILAIDCSVSAWNTVLSDGQTRLEKQKEAAKELIISLLDQENIYIGIVCFAGNQSAWRAIGQTNSREVLEQTLDEIKENGKCNYVGLPGGTNIIQALDKANDSFVGKESNKWIILLSDGAPTTDGTTQIYNDDSDKDLIQKLNIISNNTKEKYKYMLFYSRFIR